MSDLDTDPVGDDGAFGSRRIAVAVGAVIVPAAGCALLGGLAGRPALADVALGLVLIVAAAAVAGRRLAGLVAAVSAGASFDFFLTVPVRTFAISDPGEVVTFVLIVAVGVAITEIVEWGRRQHSRASRESGYLTGLIELADQGSERPDGAAGVGSLEHALVRTLSVDRVVHHPGTPPAGLTTLTRDGRLRTGDRVREVEPAGLPTDREIALPVVRDDQVVGWFEIVAAARTAHPTRRRCQVAALLADRAGGSARPIRPDAG